MENHERLTSNILVDDLDLTLRLGLPFQGLQKQENAQGNWLKQEGEVDATKSNEVCQNTREGVKSPRSCKECGKDTTPLWRKGPDGPQTLCNACGLRYARLMKKLA